MHMYMYIMYVCMYVYICIYTDIMIQYNIAQVARWAPSGSLLSSHAAAPCHPSRRQGLEFSNPQPRKWVKCGLFMEFSEVKH